MLLESILDVVVLLRLFRLFGVGALHPLPYTLGQTKADKSRHNLLGGRSFLYGMELLVERGTGAID